MKTYYCPNKLKHMGKLENIDDDLWGIDYNHH